MRCPAEILLSGQGLTLKNSWCCRQDASRTPCKQPAEGFFRRTKCFSAKHRPFPSAALSLTPLPLQPEVNAWSGVLGDRNEKKKKKPQANRQSTSGTSLSKGKRASQGKQFVFPSKLASCSNTRGQQWALSESLKSQFYGGWVMARRIMPREAYQLCFYVVYTR